MASKTVPEDQPPEEQTDTIQQLPPQPTTVNGHLPNHDDHDEDHEPNVDESTPLIHRATSNPERNTPNPKKRSWWTIISIIILLIITINIIVFAFVIPSATQSYASQATTYSLQNVETQDYTEDGIIANAQINITVDASRVSSNGVRNIGLFTTKMFRHVYTQPCLVSVFLPQYNGAQIAVVTLPALKIDIRNRHVNILDITSNVTITNETLVVQLAGDYLTGRRQVIQTIGEADVDIKAGIIPLGRHHVRQQVIIQGR